LSRTVAEAELHGNKAAAEERQVLAYHEKAAKEVEKANDMIKQLRSKFKNLLGPDDLPLPKLNPSDTQKLTNAMKKCSSHLESAQSRLKIAESALEEKKSRTQKMATLVKQATKASTAAATSLKKKRAQMSENKSGRSRGRLSETWRQIVPRHALPIPSERCKRRLK
jgi:plasmid stabilization system protein ParE